MNALERLMGIDSGDDGNPDVPRRHSNVDEGVRFKQVLHATRTRHLFYYLKLIMTFARSDNPSLFFCASKHTLICSMVKPVPERQPFNTYRFLCKDRQFRTKS
ncbi:hypothetical protein ACLB1Q_24360 [Escherichia coli]